MSTFLELCQQTRSDCGAAGTGPTHTENQTGEYARIVKYVADADLYIQTRWEDWHFLWRDLRFDSVVNQRVYNDIDVDASTKLNDVLGHFNHKSFVWNPDETYQEINWNPWTDFKRANYFGPHDASIPSVVTQRPDNALVFYPGPQTVKPIYCEYWQRPARMVAHDAISPIPLAFERAIVCLATRYYAQYEEAAELYQMADAEYMEWLQRLESAELSMGLYRNRSQLGDGDIVIQAL